MNNLIRKPKALTILVMIILSALLSFAFLIISPLKIFVIIICVLFVIIAFTKPEIAILGILVITSSIIDKDQLPSFDLGIITLQISDLVLFGLFFLLCIRLLIEPEFENYPYPFRFTFSNIFCHYPFLNLSCSSKLLNKIFRCKWLDQNYVLLLDVFPNH